ncbi:MAG: extracellular solute-binding protein [Clostridia bacterium]|nr:extracellular solute-binding protein [Clostridia bacterium]
MKRTLTVFLCALLAASSVLTASCASEDKPSSTPTTTAAVTEVAETEAETEARILPDLPEGVTYEGYEFNVLHWYVDGWEWRMSKDIYAESENGDPINDAVYKRNSTLNEKYGFTVTLQNEAHGNVAGLVQKSVKGGDDPYDAVFARSPEAVGLITGGMLLNLHQIENMDLTKPWWDQNSIESLTIDGKLYIISSDISIVDKDATAAIAFSKKIAEDNNLPNLYDAIKNGEWTIDYMVDTYKNVARDLNGDQKMDEEDLYGFLGGRDVTSTFFQGGGAMIISPDEDGYPVLTFAGDRNFALLEKLYNFTTDTEKYYNHHVMGTDDTEYEQLFANGHGLYYWMRLDNVTSLRYTDNDFGILPSPKYDESQEDYCSAVSIHTGGLLSVPTSAKDPARTGFILEALAAESKYTLIPAYIEKSLKGKHVRDAESEDMLEIILANRIFDMAEFYGLGGLRDTTLLLSESKSFNVASAYQKMEKSTNKQIEKFVSQIDKLP